MAPSMASTLQSAIAALATDEFFPTVANIPYEGPRSTKPLAFRFYNKEEVILGKPMKDWLRFSVVFWHTMKGSGSDPFGGPSLLGARNWQVLDCDLATTARTQILMASLRRVDAAFEIFQKLGVDFFTFHDRDIAQELGTIDETNDLLDAVSDYVALKQKKTGIKLLWGTANLFSHPRYMNGALSSPDLKVFSYAAAQVKKAMEVTHKLGGEGYVFWGGREGYQSLLNTDIRKENDHMAAFFRMAVAHKKKIGADFAFYIEPKPKEPTKHQYDYDAQTVIGFLKTYNLDKDFKLNIEPNHTTLAGHAFEHDIVVASAFDMLGSVDCNTGDESLGWDTDQFLMDDRRATAIMLAIIKMGGFKTGGLNFDCKVRRESTDPADIFIAHIGSMDTFARGLRQAAHIVQNNKLPMMVSDRYASWKSEEGALVERGDSSFERLEEFAKGLEARGMRVEYTSSGKQETFERVFNDEIFDALAK